MKTLTIKEIPEDALNGFKAWCALHGKSMQAVLVEHMREKAALIKVEKKK